MFCCKQILRLGVFGTLAVCAFCAAAQTTMGRLLLSPEGRLLVERSRQVSQSASASPAPPVQSDDVSQVVDVKPSSWKHQSQRIDGWVLRSEGRSTLWVNQEPIYRVDGNDSVQHELKARGLWRERGVLTEERSGHVEGPLRLQPGQTLVYDAAGNPQVTDILPQGAITLPLNHRSLMR